VLCISVNDDNYEVPQVQFLSGENGECVRMIMPQVSHDFDYFHCAEVKDDQYVLAYDGHELDDNGRISLFDGEGNVLRSTYLDDLMRYPYHVVVDSDQFVMVCNVSCKCVDLFDPTLDYVCNMTDSIRMKPQTMVFDEFTRRLYIAESRPRVSIVQV